ncbi:MAG TPA: hypothetical protein VJQ60_12300 [Arthrobacter sp.]|nr:hypothetical protein [Arthrobacter sp.]
MYTNTRRLGAVASGPIIALGSISPLGYHGVFATCAGLTLVAAVMLMPNGRKS